LFYKVDSLDLQVDVGRKGESPFLLTSPPQSSPPPPIFERGKRNGFFLIVGGLYSVTALRKNKKEGNNAY